MALIRLKTARHQRIGPRIIVAGVRSRRRVGNAEPSRAASVLAHLLVDVADRSGLYFLKVYDVRK